MLADKKTVLRLINTAKGQLEGITKMVDEDRYCMDIYNQLLATEAVIRRANKEILSAHLENCVRNAAKGEELDEKVREIIALLDKHAK